MPAQVYEIVALGARYWFAFLGVVIVWRSFAWLRKDGRIRRKRLKQLPDAGLVGELVVLAGSDTLPPGTSIPLPREGTLGSLRSCDVSIPCPGVAPLHGDFKFVDGVGLVLTAAPRQAFQVDKEESAPKQREWVMHHGSRLVVGDALLRLRLFMGLATSRTAAFQEDADATGYDLPPQPAMMQGDWEEGGELRRTSYDIPAMDRPAENPDWEDDTVPHHQQLLSWQDTGRYNWDQGAGYPPEEEAPEEPEDDWAYPEPEEDEETSVVWEQEADEAETPAPRRGLFSRRR